MKYVLLVTQESVIKTEEVKRRLMKGDLSPEQTKALLRVYVNLVLSASAVPEDVVRLDFVE